MLINIDIGQCTDIDLVFTLLGKCIRCLLIQAVDTFDHQNIIRSQLFEIAFILPLSGLEIEGRQLHALSGQQSAHVIIKLLYINGFQTFEIVITVLIPWREFSVHEIVVQCNGMRCFPQGLQLNG